MLSLVTLRGLTNKLISKAVSQLFTWKLAITTQALKSIVYKLFFQVKQCHINLTRLRGLSQPNKMCLKKKGMAWPSHPRLASGQG